MARCGNPQCRAKIEKQNQFSSFQNWCSDGCKAVIQQLELEKKKKKLNSKFKTQSKKSTKINTTPKVYSTLKAKKPWVAKPPAKKPATGKGLKTFTPLKGSALGSKQYKDEQKARNSKRKAKMANSGLPTYVPVMIRTAAKELAVKVCHLYIRTRDFGKPCFCCGKPLGTHYDAGHYQEAGNNTAIKLDETNIHGQRLDCNRMKGGDSGDAEANLRIRIGDRAVDRLNKIAKSRKVVKLTLEDYLEIIRYYREKLKELEMAGGLSWSEFDVA